MLKNNNNNGEKTPSIKIENLLNRDDEVTENQLADSHVIDFETEKIKKQLKNI